MNSYNESYEVGYNLYRTTMKQGLTIKSCGDDAYGDLDCAFCDRRLFNCTIFGSVSEDYVVGHQCECTATIIEILDLQKTSEAITEAGVDPVNVHQ
jgi:hypothetical protein